MYILPFSTPVTLFIVYSKVYIKLSGKFVLYVDCVHVLLHTCVEVVNAIVLISVEGRQVVYYV